MSVHDLLRRIARGERGAFTLLYRDQRDRAVRFATGLLAGDVAAAEDVVDDAFIDIWQQAGRYAGTGSAQGWIMRIVRNKAIDWLRRRREGLIGPEVLDHMADDADSPFDAAAAGSDARFLKDALACLSPEHREVIWLCYYEDMPLAEIAQIAECPENTVKTRLYHARRNLRGMMDDVMVS